MSVTFGFMRHRHRDRVRALVDNSLATNGGTARDQRRPWPADLCAVALAEVDALAKAALARRSLGEGGYICRNRCR